MFTKRQISQALELLETFDQYDLSKMVYKSRNFGVTIGLKSPKEDRVHSVNVEKVASIESPISIKTMEAEGESAAVQATPITENFEKVHSPITGAFYIRPKPDADVFVSEGSMVEAHTTVCLLEAMKMFTEIKAGVKGKIVKIYPAENGFVTEGDVLFDIKPM